MSVSPTRSAAPRATRQSSVNEPPAPKRRMASTVSRPAPPKSQPRTIPLPIGSTRSFAARDA